MILFRKCNITIGYNTYDEDWTYTELYWQKDISNPTWTSQELLINARTIIEKFVRIQVNIVWSDSVPHKFNYISLQIEPIRDNIIVWNLALALDILWEDWTSILWEDWTTILEE